MRVTWTKGAVPPRFGYFVEGQSNSRRRRPRRDPRERLSADPVGRPVGDIVSSTISGIIWRILFLYGQIIFICPYKNKILQIIPEMVDNLQKSLGIKIISLNLRVH